MIVDLVAMLDNLAESLLQVQKLITGLAYCLGLICILIALFKCLDIANTTANKHNTPIIAYLLIGAFLLFLPSTLQTFSNTFFGAYNALQYTSTDNSHDLYSSMNVLIQTAGLIWFVRGCMLLANSSEPGQEHGVKGFVFIIAGILAINFEATIAGVNYMANSGVNVALIQSALNHKDLRTIMS